MIENLKSKDWQVILKDEIDKNYFKELTNFVSKEYKDAVCYPPKKDIFQAFNYCNFKDVKVVILGQDPYHGFGQANGLCFSVSDGISFPPSLKNIFKEIETDLNIPFPISGNLERWASQGVFLLNSVLTVEEGKPESHKNKGWEKFTDFIIQKLSETEEQIIFLFWGSFAKKKGSKINRLKHIVLESGHPSPLSANRGFWFGNKHFGKTNNFLEKNNKPIISW
ncbi:MAG: uracil-DNA glycosylase [Flavobacterium sp.]|jgi:uracil-DNA glycosylase